MKRAFSLIELLVVIAIIALLVSILLPALATARRAGKQTVCIANLQQLGRAQHAYAADFKDHIATFNGLSEHRSRVTGSMGWPMLLDVGWQANTIVNSVMQPEKYPPDFFNIQKTDRPTPVLAENHSYLAMINYLGTRLPTPGTACPEDRVRLEWHKDPSVLINNKNIKLSTHNDLNRFWLPLSSSYELYPAGWLRDQRGTFTTIARMMPVFQHDTVHDLYKLPKAHYDGAPTEAYGGNKMSDVFSPANKVSMGDSQQRHAGKRDIFFLYENAHQPLLFWDSSVRSKITRESNRGWHRAQFRQQTLAAEFEYKPDPVFESAPFVTGGSGPISARSLHKGYYKWTRGGLAGIDFGGSEITTSNW